MYRRHLFIFFVYSPEYRTVYSVLFVCKKAKGLSGAVHRIFRGLLFGSYFVDVCEASRDKSQTFPRLPVQSPHQGYVCLLDFAALCQPIRLIRLVIGRCMFSSRSFLSVGPRFRFPFFSPKRRRLNLGTRYRVRRQLRRLGLSPKLRDMPVIHRQDAAAGRRLALSTISLVSFFRSIQGFAFVKSAN